MVTDILANSMPDMARLTMGDVNRAHRVGQRKRQDQHTQRPKHPRQILVQFKDYNGKLNIMFKKANSGNNATRIHSLGLNPISSYTAVQSTLSQA